MSFRVLLVYPPASQDTPREPSPGGDDADLLFMPYGMLTIAAELRWRGFHAEVVNLSTVTREQALAAIQDSPADLIGLSCYTFHRHAAAALGAEIKRSFPQCHLTAGGPHVSALAREWLEHYPAFDTVVIGEGERTVVELAERLRDGQPPCEVAGTAYRAGGRPALGPIRELIPDLDSLARPWDHFDYGVLVTSRGCPGKCTFCCSPKLWGQKIRFRSAENVLEELEELVVARGHRFLFIKDDTFTARKTRLLAICRGIVERGLVFRWACDTRVDLVDPEILAAMRRAGCVRLHLGIESASPVILRNLNKRIDPAEALTVTRDARDLGLDVRFYLIVGSRGETPDTVRETLEFVEKARPTTCLFHGLAIYPGTGEHEMAERAGRLAAEDYFDPGALGSDFFNLGESSPEMDRVIRVVGKRLFGKERAEAPYTTAEREQILARHPDILLSYLDLAICYAQQWRLDDAQRVLHRASQAAGGEMPEILHYLACVSFVQRDFPASQAYFSRARAAAPQDTSLIRNWQTLQAAGSMDHQKQAEVAMQLVANLRSTELLYLRDGTRQLTTGPSGNLGFGIPNSIWPPVSHRGLNE